MRDLAAEVNALIAERDRYRDALANMKPEPVKTSINRHTGEWEHERFCPVCDGTLDHPAEHDDDCAWVEAQQHKDNR